MPGLRGHEPVVIERFGGLWQRGDPESAPSDHFTVAQNIQYFDSGFETRSPVDIYMANALGPLNRVYDYVTADGQSLLVHYVGGIIFHIKNGIATQILSIPTMEDFGFVAIAGRAYITPWKSYADTQGKLYELGIQNEFIYVYNGDGTPARKAGGFPPSNSNAVTLLAYNSTTDGIIDRGIHSIAISFNGGLPGPVIDSSNVLGTEVFRIVNAPGAKQIQLDHLPIGPAGTTSRQIHVTKAIPPEKFDPNPLVYIYYTLLTIPDNIKTSTLVNVKDADFGATIGGVVLYPPYTPGGIPAPLTTGLLVTNTTIVGFCDYGFHLVGVVYETDTGYLTAIGPMNSDGQPNFGGQTYVDTTKSIRVSNIPISPNTFVKKRHLVSTKAITNFNGDQKNYQFFFIPEGNIDDNTTTSKVVKYYDSDLLDDASHLVDNFSEIPAGVNLNTYHSRMVIVGEFGTVESLAGGSIRTRHGARIIEAQKDNRSLARVSAPGEPEAISKVDGLIVAPLDGNPLTHCQEFRDILYLFKSTRTYGYSDNQDEPATWQEEIIDQGVGAPVHGIATVLDSGGVNVDFLLITDLSGLMLFNGVYSRPELSWKIENYWKSLNRNEMRSLQIVNDSLNKKIWIITTHPMRNTVLHADYGDGIDAKSIKWSKWYFDYLMTGAALIETDKLVFTSTDGVYFINTNKAGFYDSYYGNVNKRIPDPTISTAFLGE